MYPFSMNTMNTSYVFYIVFESWTRSHCIHNSSMDFSLTECNGSTKQISCVCRSTKNSDRNQQLQKSSSDFGGPTATGRLGTTILSIDSRYRWSRPPARSHARTKLNDVLVGVTKNSPQSPLYIWMCIYIERDRYMYACVGICICVCTYIYIYIYIHICNTYACTYVYVCVYIYIYIHEREREVGRDL